MGACKNLELTLTEVLDYACPYARIRIWLHASTLPAEQKEEIKQNVLLRIVELFKSIDPNREWRDFVRKHVRGAVLDYLRAGMGFQEDRWSLQAQESKDFEYSDKINCRVGAGELIEDTLEANHKFHFLDFDSPKINWELLARMSSVDQRLHIFAKYIRGFRFAEIASVLGLPLGTTTQLFYDFVAQFKDEAACKQIWFRQSCFALGLCRVIGIREQYQRTFFDNKIAWDLKRVNLDDRSPSLTRRKEAVQLELL